MNLTLTLAVADLERSEIFYREFLGLAIERRQPGKNLPDVLFLKQGGCTLLFRERAVLQARHPALFENLDRHPLGQGVTIELEVTHLDLLRQRAERQQRHVLYELQDDESGWQELWLHDPDDYLLVLSQAR